MPMPRECLSPIMIVDDEPDDIALMRRLLKSAKLENPVLPFVDSAEALEFLRAIGNEPEAPLLRPSVLFLDIKMPKVHGFVFLKWVRRQNEFDDMKMIVVSGSENPEDRERAMKLGADLYLVKFPTAEELATVISGLSGLVET